jgi:hypothetical protein
MRIPNKPATKAERKRNEEDSTVNSGLPPGTAPLSARPVSTTRITPAGAARDVRRQDHPRHQLHQPLCRARPRACRGAHPYPYERCGAARCRRQCGRTVACASSTRSAASTRSLTFLPPLVPAYCRLFVRTSYCRLFAALIPIVRSLNSDCSQPYLRSFIPLI